MINYVGKSDSSSIIFYDTKTFENFVEWENQLLSYQLDTETNVVNSIVDRTLKLIQFGDVDGKQQWVINPRELTNIQAKKLQEILSNPTKLKLIQNASFEYQILKKYGIELANVWDTMLMEKIIWCGYKTPMGFYGLKAILNRYLFLEISKELQTSFDSESYTPEQIQYAADDVKYLGFIMRLQKTQLKLQNLEYVAALENEAVLGLSEIEYHGMKLDIPKWRENIALAEPVIEDANTQLEEYIRSDGFRDKCIELGFLTDKESLAINWNSTLQKKLVFGHLFPDLAGFTQPVIKKYIKNGRSLQHSTEESSSEGSYTLLEAYLTKQYESLEHELLTSHREFLISNELLVESDKVLINWQSPPQRLKVFKIVEPHLKSTDKQDLADCDHPIIEAYQEYINATKLKTSFGEKFIAEQVDTDGKVRTHFNQIINTGRVSTSKPNMQNIPAKENVGNRYRNCFIADPGWLFIDSDYKSQEAVLVAYFSGDKIWMNALKENQDLHSVCAEVVFKSKWKDAADTGCDFYKVVEGKMLKQKCKCKEHKKLRTLVKTINFGLVYGMSKYKLSATAKITLEEAQEVIDDYFRSFPGISGILSAFGRFGVNHGFIMTSKPFNRRRYYDYWEERRDNSYWMGKVERASKNMPFQGTAADITKLAIILIDWYIKDNGLQDKVRLVAQVHDQVTTNAVEEYADEWLGMLDKLMCDAASFIVPDNLLGADTTNTGFCWSK